MEEKLAQLEKLLNNQDAVANIFVEDVDSTLANLSERGIVLTKDELAELAVGIREGVMNFASDGELSEENLESVAGGWPKIGFFNGYIHGGIDIVKDGPSGSCRTTNGGFLYRLGYKCAMKIAGC